MPCGVQGAHGGVGGVGGVGGADAAQRDDGTLGGGRTGIGWLPSVPLRQAPAALMSTIVDIVQNVTDS